MIGSEGTVKAKGYPLLTGARGKQPVDIEKLIDTLMAFDAFVADYGPQLAEIDINPLLVTADGCTVLDALLVPK